MPDLLNLRIFIFIALLVIFITNPLQAGAVRVNLDISQDEIRVGDPLFIKVLVWNGGEEVVQADPELGAEFGTVQFEARKNANEVWKGVDTKFQGLKSPDVAQPRWIQPSRGYVAYEILFLGPKEQKPIFSDPGMHQLRATVILGDRAKRPLGKSLRVTSEPVTITVKKIPEAEKKLIVESAELLSRVIGIDGISHDVNSADLAAIKKELGESNLRNTLQWICLIMKIRRAEDPAIAQGARETLDRLREEADPITAEIIGLVLARMYMEMEEWKQATKILYTLTSLSHNEERMKHRAAFHEDN